MGLIIVLVVLAFGFIAFDIGKKNGLFDSKSTSMDSLPGEEVQTTIKKDKIKAAGLNLVFMAISQVILFFTFIMWQLTIMDNPMDAKDYNPYFLVAIGIITFLNIRFLYLAGDSLLESIDEKSN